MKFEGVPIPVGVENVDLTVLMLLAGALVAVALVAISQPRLFALLAVVGGGIAGGLLTS